MVLLFLSMNTNYKMVRFVYRGKRYNVLQERNRKDANSARVVPPLGEDSSIEWGVAVQTGTAFFSGATNGDERTMKTTGKKLYSLPPMLTFCFWTIFFKINMRASNTCTQGPRNKKRRVFGFINTFFHLVLIETTY